MSEWESFIAVFWLLWAIDGVKIAPRAIFTVAGWRRRARVVFSRLSRPGLSPASWRATATEVPLVISPRGFCNRPAGTAGRPAEAPHVARAWIWEDVRAVVAADGWLIVNGERFCRDTGHITVGELLAMAKTAPTAREARVRALFRRWLRPVHLGRRARVLEARTRGVAGLNALALVGYAAVSLYIIGDGAGKIPERTSRVIAEGLPWALLGLVAVHFGGAIAAWRAMRRLRPVAAQKRGMNLFTALLMPPQAMRLRALVSEGFFPAQHPLAVLLAFGRKRAQREAAFNTLSDLRWPIGGADDPPLAREIAVWFREALRAEIEPRLQAAGLGPAVLLAAPKPDNPASCTYCPRCGDQFVAGRQVCPNGVELKALTPR